MSEGKVFAIIVVIALVIVALTLFVATTPVGRAAWNSLMYDVKKADDATKYETRKQVEDTCRSMMASYTSDKLTYEQYNGNDSKEKQSWADQAKMRANKTAASYNEYVLKNSFVWDGNVPEDIKKSLEYVQ